MKCWNEVVTELHGRRLVVPCGKCYACRFNKRMEWTFRLSKELSVSYGAYFVTLTYSDDYVPIRVDKKTGEIAMVLSKVDLQAFIKRLRYYSKFRYFAVGEYGEKTMRPHYHLLIFNLSREAACKIENVWSVGNIDIGQVNTQTMLYVTKDMMKPKTKKEVLGVPGFRIMSTKPGIGTQIQIINQMMNNKLDKDFQVFLNGYKIAMPRCYRDKVFSIKEKDKHMEDMIRQADSDFLRYLDNCEKKGISNPFLYLNKTRKDMIRVDDKSMNIRKL